MQRKFYVSRISRGARDERRLRLTRHEGAVYYQRLRFSKRTKQEPGVDCIERDIRPSNVERVASEEPLYSISQKERFSHE
jgi:hypothetical protein